MIVYDEETYPNLYSLAALDHNNPSHQVIFELSDRRNDMPQMMQWLQFLSENKIEMDGYNNIGFDYPVLHAIIMSGGTMTVEQIYAKAMSIIQGDRFAHTIWPKDRIVPQLDLFKIHHFDNMARATSLKALQINMRSASVEDLPFPVGTILTHDQMDVVLSYNMHDVTETDKFLHETLDQIAFRRELSTKYQRDFMNHNDTKIGKDYFVMELEKANPDSCFEYVDGRRQPRQTPRSSIALADVIFPYIQFDRPEFQRILDWFKDQTITETKGVFKDVHCTVDGFRFDFGVGGIHGSVEGQTVRPNADNALIDLDVASYYPNIGIANKIHPAHLGSVFCDIYKDVYEQRKQHKKGTAENAMLKLALNGVYGDSNNKYSPFYDPFYTMSITINGQLMLCMLAEKLMAIPGLTMVQINTDGLTIRVPREHEWMVTGVREWWEAYTCLELEEARYDMMAIRDVNNYIAVDESGKVKLKGAYETAHPRDRAPLGWHQNTSSMVIAKAAESAIVDGEDVRQFILTHQDPFDFMIRAKAPRGSELIMEHIDPLTGEVIGHNIQKTSRVYVAVDGESVFKNSPPPPGEHEGWFKRGVGVSKTDYMTWHKAWGNTHNPDIHTKNKSIYENRRIGILVGWKARECNKLSDFDWSNLNTDYYIEEAMKLVQGVK